MSAVLFYENEPLGVFSDSDRLIARLFTFPPNVADDCEVFILPDNPGLIFANGRLCTTTGPSEANQPAPAREACGAAGPLPCSIPEQNRKA